MRLRRYAHRLLAGISAAVCLLAGCAKATETLSVVGGAGSGDHPPGAQVEVTAREAPPGHVFVRWVGDEARLDDPGKPVAKFRMPNHHARIAALFKPTAEAKPARDVACYGAIEIDLEGPAYSGPLLADLVFQGPSGARIVPVFHAHGRTWRARFSPDAEGTWTWLSHSGERALDLKSGSFRVGPPDDASGPFARRGGIRHASGPYLVYGDGAPWLKGGADDPEDFLGHAHFANFDERRAAVDFLAECGINSLYLMTLNIDGDHRNVWPFEGATEAEAKRDPSRFDSAKLAEWEGLFAHMQRRGVLLHLVLEDDEAWNGFDRALYYREMVARFAHHRGLVWNLSEEFNENYDAQRILRFAALLRSLDPYDHPIAVHQAGDPSNLLPLFGDRNFEVASVQTNKAPQNPTATDLFRRASACKHRPVLWFDETGKLAPGDRALARHILWSAYLGGASFELHTWPIFTGKYTYEDYESMLRDVGRARRFFEEHLPFAEMEPHNELLRDGVEAYLFAAPGRVYVAYTPGGASLSFQGLGSAGQRFRVRWFNPSTGDSIDAPPLAGGSPCTIGKPPFDGDAVALIELDDG